ncbi:hypothetical protein MILUP08_42204 [Micromonospora lupini str. Lupac 08]|uniref:Uncharacterized protein n=1 Tax=Micromonospora lupini str. Lupac 08 TaxID=1150864 RepID=I0L0D7_9ACTN|nr:hypothetical protein MILUP08_42204 [Micromonospora lupini str. Lupac 08]
MGPRRRRRTARVTDDAGPARRCGVATRVDPVHTHATFDVRAPELQCATGGPARLRRSGPLTRDCDLNVAGRGGSTRVSGTIPGIDRAAPTVTPRPGRGGRPGRGE